MGVGQEPIFLCCQAGLWAGILSFPLEPRILSLLVLLKDLGGVGSIRQARVVSKRATVSGDEGQNQGFGDDKLNGDVGGGRQGKGG